MFIFAFGRTVSELQAFFYFSDFFILSIFLKNVVPYALHHYVETPLKPGKILFFWLDAPFPSYGIIFIIAIFYLGDFLKVVSMA